MNTADSQPTRDPFDRLAESFLDRFRRGERPSISEYVKANPELATDIEELFPALVEVEQLKSEGATDSFVATKRPVLSKLGDYQILGVVGEGGMGIVYDALRTSLRSRVALKIMHPRFRENARYLRRFHVEACAAACLHHTNIVSVFDYGEIDGVVYYTMPYITGQSLETILRDIKRIRGKLSDEYFARVAHKASDRLESDLTLCDNADSPASSRGATASNAVVTGLLTGCFGGPAEPAEPNQPSAEEKPRADPQDTPVESASRSSSTRQNTSSALSEQTEDRYYREVARIGAQVADALSYAHQRGILHRDIKPSNLLIDELGNVWVTDFGLAKFEEGENVSLSRDLIGTLRYMAPERLRGVSNRCCDIYALGATLYEMLTLRPPFGGTDQHALMHQIVHEPPVSLRQHDRKIAGDLEILVLKALAKDPRDRFTTAQQMSEELRRFVEGRPIQSRAFPGYERVWRWCKRNPGLASLTALAAGLIVTLAVAATAAAYVFRTQRNALEAAQKKTHSSLTRAESAEGDLRRQLGLTRDAERKAVAARHRASLALGESLLNEGAALQRSGAIGQRHFSLDRLGRAAQILRDDPDGQSKIPVIRDHVIAALGLTDIRIRNKFNVDTDLMIEVDRNFELLTYVDARRRETFIRRVRDGETFMRIPAPKIPFWYGKANFSPDGRYLRIRYAVRGELGITEVWRLEDRQCVLSTQTRADAYAFHPNGRDFYYAPGQTGLAVWDLEARREVKRLPFSGRNPLVLLLDLEHSRFMVNDIVERAIRIVDLETGRELERWTESSGRNAMSISADGRLLASADTNGSIFIWDMKRQTLASSLLGHTQFVGQCRFAPRSHVLATSSWDYTLRFWDASLGRPLLDVKQASFVAFAPDETRVALLLADKEFAVGDVAYPESYQALNPEMIGNRSYEQTEQDGVRCAQFSPDGQLLGIGLQEGLHLYQAKTGAYLGLLNSGPCDSVHYDSSGTAVISGGVWGYYRWPIRRSIRNSAAESVRTEALRIGPPELITPLTQRPDVSKAAWLPDQKTLAVIDNPAAQIRLIDMSQSHPALRPYDALFSAQNHRLTTVAISPDGRWAASGGWKEWGIMLWDLPARRLVRILAASDAPSGSSICFVAFSPDGKKMVSSSFAAVYDYFVWDVDSWTRKPLLSERGFASQRAPVFNRDGSILSLLTADSQIRLIDMATERTLANLSNSLSLNSTPIAFSPDGTQLLAGTSTKTALLWNLRRVREWLRTMKLDWDSSPYPAGAEPVAPPLEVEVIGQVLAPDAKHQDDFAEASVRLLLNPDDTDALMMRGNVLAARAQDGEAIRDLVRRRELITHKEGPDQGLALILNRHARRRLNLKPADPAPQETVELAKLAVEIAPNARDYLNTLGIALCRAGRDAEALPHLQKSLDTGTGQTDAQDLYFLAIAHHRLGHVETAKEFLKRAQEWHARHVFSLAVVQDELNRFRAEAEAILAVSPSEAVAKGIQSRLSTQVQSFTNALLKGGPKK